MDQLAYVAPVFATEHAYFISRRSYDATVGTMPAFYATVRKAWGVDGVVAYCASAEQRDELMAAVIRATWPAL